MPVEADDGVRTRRRVRSRLAIPASRPFHVGISCSARQLQELGFAEETAREIGRDYAQGYLVSRALPAGEIERFLKPDERRRC